MRVHLRQLTFIHIVFLLVKLKAAVIVPSDYPVRTPLFKMAVSSNGSYVNNDYVRVCGNQENVLK